MANKKSINYKQLLRNMYCVESIKLVKVTFTGKFKSPVKIDALQLPIISINSLRQNKNTHIWVSDDFGNSISLSKLSNDDCKLIFKQIKNDIIKV